MKETLSLHSTIVLATDQVSADLDGEMVILNFGSGVYYGLDAVGARVWQLIQEPRVVESIRNTLLEEYEVESERCERELFSLLQQLATEGLIQINNQSEHGLPEWSAQPNSP
jgi:hypothetical protein